MFKRIKVLGLVIACVAITTQAIGQKDYKYETYAGDPLKARIYTLDNGLKVYMSVYKDAPRIQALVAVRVGSKNDPKETTGLAHYLEHMMFKGSSSFGTTSWEKERPMIVTIDSLFEVYRVETDVAKRKAIYHVIDSISYEASKIAIPNEYDKLMATIGSQGTNAGTSNDYTVYIENIPSNQIENWADIQSNRFGNLVLRLFHTELETVYEEKNMSLTNDGRKMNDAMFKALYPNHPYGQQTTIGDAEHLKNPSMKNIRKFVETYYVPNNMAISMSGDFNPDEAIKIIDQYFGQLKASPVPAFVKNEEKSIENPISSDVVGLEAESMRLAYRFGGANSDDAIYVDLIANILANGKAGLIDLNINQKMLCLGASAFNYGLSDYSTLVVTGRNKGGQSLDEVKDLLLQQIDLLKRGEFPDWLLEATINNMKLDQMKEYESNDGRAMAMAQSFLSNIPYEKMVSYIDRLSKVTKADVVKFANERMGNNYVAVYKRQGTPADVAKVEKPAITPIFINRDVESDFLKRIKARKVVEIAPVFVDFEKDIVRLTTKSKVPILYTENAENKTFSLYYYFNMGSFNDKMTNLAAGYLNYLGTSKYTAEQLKQEFYKLGCSYRVFSSNEETYISISGLSDNQEKAIALVEEILNDVQPDATAYSSYIANILKSRKDAKANQRSNSSAIMAFATYGPKNPFTNIVTESELNSLKPEELVAKIKNLKSYKHEVLYYGPTSAADLKKVVEKYHVVPAKLVDVPAPVKFAELETSENRVVFAQYNAKQSYLQSIIASAPYKYDATPVIDIYNNYFGGSMNAIVFQELREKRGLAYTARSIYAKPNRPEKRFMNQSFIATQNDKVVDAFDAFNDLFNNMPLSETAFQLAKESMISDIRTGRITKMDLIFTFIDARKFGLNYDSRRDLFAKIPAITMNDMKTFNDNNLKDKSKTYVILGNESDLDFKVLEQKYGKVTKLSQEEIFGY